MILEHNIKENIGLAGYTTFKIGGPARYFVEVDDLQRMEGILRWARDHQQKIFILGGGSNLLFMDSGFDGLVIKVTGKELNISVNNDGGVIKAQAGLSLAKLVAESFRYNLTGLEWAVGIPGTVGGAVRGNAGAFGGEMKDVTSAVDVLNLKREDLKKKEYIEPVIYPNELPKNLEYCCQNLRQKLGNKDCQFKYRESLFKHNPYLLIWQAELKLKPGNGEESRKIAEEYLKKRKDKQPNVTKFPSAGSVFKNPHVSKGLQEEFEKDSGSASRNGKVPAGWLIARCGLLGKRIGDAMVSEEHGNFIVNMGRAKADEVLMLIGFIKTRVRNMMGVQLQEEICIVY